MHNLKKVEFDIGYNKATMWDSSGARIFKFQGRFYFR